MSIWSSVLPPDEYIARQWRNNETGFILDQLTTNYDWQDGIEYAIGSWWLFPSGDGHAIAYRAWKAQRLGDQIEPPLEWADEMIRGWGLLSAYERDRFWPVDWDLVVNLRAQPERQTFTARDIRHPFGINGP